MTRVKQAIATAALTTILLGSAGCGRVLYPVTEWLPNGDVVAKYKGNVYNCDGSKVEYNDDLFPSVDSKYCVFIQESSS